jgi:sugar lactone lactonase YvrE
VCGCDSVRTTGNRKTQLTGSRAATIYAFDVLQRAGAEFLANQRLFAYAVRGIPMGVKCDAWGNVYAGCADGVEVWNPGGTLLGVIEVPGEILTNQGCLVFSIDSFNRRSNKLLFRGGR